MMDKIEGTVRTFILSFLKAGLYAILAISIIGIMGVPMASVVAVFVRRSGLLPPVLFSMKKH